MSNIVFPPLEQNFENMTPDLERLETLYAEKRELEAQIENTISDVDREAIRELKSAEEELQEANLRCASMIARLQRATGDRSPPSEESTSTNVFEAMQGADPTIQSPHMGVITVLRSPSEDDVLILGPILSPVSTCSDLGSLSIFSDISVESSRVPQLTGDVVILNISDPPVNVSHRLTSLVQRYHSLCYTIDNLRDGINKQAEAMTANALAKIEHAKMQLEASREKARAIVEGMGKASNANIYARIPWLLSKDSNPRKPLSVVPPLAPTADLYFGKDPKDETASSQPMRCDSQGLLTPPPTAHPHSPCFDKYERMMNIIKSRIPGDVWPWDIPWPILPRLIHNFPVRSNHSLLASDAVGNSVNKFIESYASWKVRPIQRVRATMLTDWTSIVDKTPVWRQGQKEMAGLIVYHLSDSV